MQDVDDLRAKLKQMEQQNWAARADDEDQAQRLQVPPAIPPHPPTQPGPGLPARTPLCARVTVFGWPSTLLTYGCPFKERLRFETARAEAGQQDLQLACSGWSLSLL